MGSVCPGTFLVARRTGYSLFLKTRFFNPSCSPSFLLEMLTSLQLSVLGLKLQGKAEDMGGVLRTDHTQTVASGVISLAGAEKASCRWR